MNQKKEPGRSREHESLNVLLQKAADSTDEQTSLSDILATFNARVEEAYTAQKELQQQTERKRTKDLEILSELSTDFRQMRTFDETVALLINKTMSVLDVDRNALLLLEDDMLVVVAGQHVNEALIGRRVPLVDTPLRTVLQNRESRFVTSETLGRILKQCEICKDLLVGSAAGAFIRLCTAEAPIGLLYVGYAAPRSFDINDKNLLDTVGGMVGNALYRANALDLLEQRVADRTQKLTTLYNVTTAANESLDRSTVLQRSLREVLVASIGDAGMIYLYNEATAALELAHQQISPAGAESDISPLLPGHQLADRVFKNEQPIVISDLHADSRVDRPAQTNGFRSYVGVPMRAGGKVLGVLGILSRQIQQFSVEEVALTNSIADHIAVAVENTRLHQQAQQFAVEDERRRLARELHDSVTQLLYSISIFAGTGRELAKQEAWDEMPRLYDRMDETVQQALREMRLLMDELQPPALNGTDLEQTLRHRLQSAERQFGVNARLVVEQAIDVPESTAQILYYITNEVLNDVVRHAAADEVTVSVLEDTDALLLEVADDGPGFDTTAVDNPRGRAVTRLREWTKKAGGTLKVVSTPNEGTILTIYLKKIHS